MGWLGWSGFGVEEAGDIGPVHGSYARVHSIAKLAAISRGRPSDIEHIRHFLLDCEPFTLDDEAEQDHPLQDGARLLEGVKGGRPHAVGEKEISMSSAFVADDDLRHMRSGVFHKPAVYIHGLSNQRGDMKYKKDILFIA